jgi:hypothetical protein
MLAEDDIHPDGNFDQYSHCGHQQEQHHNVASLDVKQFLGSGYQPEQSITSRNDPKDNSNHHVWLLVQSRQLLQCHA